MNARLAEDVFLESEFFDRADAMREQFAAALGPAGDSIFKQVSSPGAYSFFLAPAAQIFKQELVFAFLNRLRRWAVERLGTNHASTPQIHAYTSGNERALAPDATQARWHYLLSITRGAAASIRLLERAEPQKARLPMKLIPVTLVELQFNQLLVHEARQPYAITGSKRVSNLPGSAILLHGYLW